MNRIKTFNQLNESNWPKETENILHHLQEGYAILVTKEDLEEFYKAIEYYLWIEYTKLEPKVINEYLFFVLIGRKLYHTSVPNFGGEEFEVYKPTF